MKKKTKLSRNCLAQALSEVAAFGPDACEDIVSISCNFL